MKKRQNQQRADCKPSLVCLIFIFRLDGLLFHRRESMQSTSLFYSKSRRLTAGSVSLCLTCARSAPPVPKTFDRRRVDPSPIHRIVLHLRIGQEGAQVRFCMFLEMVVHPCAGRSRWRRGPAPRSSAASSRTSMTTATSSGSRPCPERPASDGNVSWINVATIQDP